MENNTTPYEDLDKKLEDRLKIIHRQYTFEEIKSYLILIEMNAKQRKTDELFIHATPYRQPVQILNANQKFKFILVTLQEIESNVDSLLMGRLKSLPYKECRITSYHHFKNRGEKLLKFIIAGKLDDYTHFSASDILFRIMGSDGELLEYLGINNKNYSINRVNQIIANKSFQLTRLRKLFESIYEPTNSENPVPPILRENFNLDRKSRRINQKY
jgi:hypothetical protein